MSYLKEEIVSSDKGKQAQAAHLFLKEDGFKMEG